MKENIINNIEKYADSTKNKFVKPMILIKVIEDTLGMNYKDIKDKVDNSCINIDQEDVMDFLNGDYIKEKIKTQNKINKYFKDKSYLKITDEQLNKVVATDIPVPKYRLEVYSYIYYEKYIAILKYKISKLLNIIGYLQIQKSNIIKEQLEELDICVNQLGNIRYDDVIRLVLPTIENFNELNRVVKKANNIFTYREVMRNIEMFEKDKKRERDIFPNKNLQVSWTITNEDYGYAPLTPLQIKKNKREQLERERALLLTIIRAQNLEKKNHKSK